MKRLLSVALAVVVAFQSLSAKGGGGSEWFHYGLTGGVSINRFGTFEEMKNSMTGWHLGVTSQINLPLYFSLQPTVMYENAPSRVMADNGDGEVVKTTLTAHNVSIPIALQWGPDLGFCRIYLQAVPVIDFNLGAEYDFGDAKDFMSKAQFGLGAGLGISIWRFQVAARYNWSFGDWKSMKEFNPFQDMTSARRGITISFAYFFR